MKKHNLKPLQRNLEKKVTRPKLVVSTVRISRHKIIHYIFSWKLLKKEYELILNNIKSILKQYPIIEIFRDFYRQFKSILLDSKRDELEKLLKIPYEDITLSKYIKSLNTHYQAVLHSAQYTYSNGVVEGNVNKLKKIKRDMYNRASIQLLRNKVIFQSLYF